MAAKLPPVRPNSTPDPAARTVGGGPGPSEVGWLPDLVYAGGHFESGMAFFADSLGRITRFSREPADLSSARRLAGQAALPGLVNSHSHAFHRVVRGRRFDRGSPDPIQVAAARLDGGDVFDTARQVFMEMLLAGVTCVGEFHYLHHGPDGTAWPEPNLLGQEIVRAAREVGIRIALLQGAQFRSGCGAPTGTATPRCGFADVDHFLGATEALRTFVEANHPADEAWIGVAPYDFATVPLDALKAIGTYAHERRFRLHLHVSGPEIEGEAGAGEYGRKPLSSLAEHGLLDKRFTAVAAAGLSDDECALVGNARATVCLCPPGDLGTGYGISMWEAPAAAGVGIALGTDSHARVNLLTEAWRIAGGRITGGTLSAAESSAALFHAATVGGARSLGTAGGALEVGRPADFFTVNLYDPALAGADADSLLSNLLLAGERRPVREVWIGARQRVANGRHALHGPIIGRFVDVQRRLWRR